MNVPTTTLLGFIGLTSLGLGIFLVLAGLDVFKVRHISVNPGRKTWATGGLFVIVGAVLLWPEIAKSMQSPAANFPSTQALPQSTTLPNTATIPLPTAPLPTSTATVIVGAPVLTAIEVHEASSVDGLFVYQDVHFYDKEGDAYYLDWKLVSTTATEVNVVSGAFEASSEDQQAGTVTTGTWRCNGGNYSVVLRATILDRAGHASNSLEVVIECH